MEQRKRKSRYRRLPVGERRPIRLSDKDSDILKLFAPGQYNYLTAELVAAATDRPINRVQHRLRQLYDNGYLQRYHPPHERIGGSTKVVYLLDQEGAKILTERFQKPVKPNRNFDPGTYHPFMEHTLLTNQFRIPVWWVVFYEPGACGTSPCGLPDLFVPAVKADVLYAAGNVIGGNGTGNFGAYLSEGDDSGSIASLFGLPAAEGLIDAETAEVHLIARSHGPKIPGQVDDQINSFGGGCSVELAGGAVPVNVGECSDIQFSIHQ